MLPLVARSALALTVLAVASACPAPPTRSASLTQKSGDTALTIDAAHASFSFGAAASASASASVDCAPFSLALRANSDTGAWHKPERPSGDEIWLHASAGAVDDKGAHFAMVDDQGNAHANATVTLADGGDGWVNMLVSFDQDEVNIAYVGTCLALASDEHLVGGGERFDGPDLRNKVVPLYFDAPGEFDSGTNESHAPVPFFASDKGYALLVDEEEVGAFDVGVESSAVTNVRFHGSALHLAVRSGSIVDNVAALARRMGLPKGPPPDFALAPMQWRNSVDVIVDAVNGNLTGTDQLLADANEMRARGIPTSTIWIDAPWETGYNTFTFNENQLPGIGDALGALESNGYHVITWATDNLNSSDDSDQAFGMPAFASRDS
ncbi:MAG TPA: TIM-barrel domain-containing protein, partial [Myxococcota bacterium]